MVCLRATADAALSAMMAAYELRPEGRALHEQFPFGSVSGRPFASGGTRLSGVIRLGWPER